MTYIYLCELQVLLNTKKEILHSQNAKFRGYADMPTECMSVGKENHCVTNKCNIMGCNYTQPFLSFTVWVRPGPGLNSGLRAWAGPENLLRALLWTLTANCGPGLGSNYRAAQGTNSYTPTTDSICSKLFNIR